MSDKIFEAAEIKEMVRARYGGIAAGAGPDCCAPVASSCCRITPQSAVDNKAGEMGYSAEELAAVPEGAKPRPRLWQSASHSRHEKRRGHR
jgi:hypothetical protein